MAPVLAGVCDLVPCRVQWQDPAARVPTHFDPLHAGANPTMSPTPSTADLRRLRDTLNSGLIEREGAVKLALLATLAGEHVLLIGPPGTAKSMISQRLRHACSGAYFERLLTRFTVPEELFGPLSIQGLESDRYERLTEGYLPKATVAFLDEIFKANSAILNALLTLLNEREFDNGTRREKTPLLALVGASNELPKGDELAALYDRFLLRVHLEPVSKQGFQGLLQLGSEAPPPIPTELQLAPDRVASIQASAAQATLPSEVQQLLGELRLWCQEQKIAVSDRRWRKIVKLLRTAAVTNGLSEVSIWDCWLLQFCCGDSKEEQRKVYEWYSGRVGTTKAMAPATLTKLVVVWEGRLKTDRGREAQLLDKQGRKLYVGADGKTTTKATSPAPYELDGEPLYVAPEGALDEEGDEIDPDNGGEGFTAEELDQLHLADGQGGTFLLTQWQGRAAYLRNKNNRFMGKVRNKPKRGSLPLKKVYQQQCLNELAPLRNDIQDHLRQFDEHEQSLRQSVTSHLWLDPAFADPAAASLAGTRTTLIELQKRIEKVHKEYSEMPVEDLFTPTGDDEPA
jgi:MoxR-like ATPase